MTLLDVSRPPPLLACYMARAALISAHVTRGNRGIKLWDNIIIKPNGGFVKAFIDLNAEMHQYITSLLDT